MELNGYLDVFRRRAALILLVAFLAVDAAALATWFGPRTYEARALLQVRATSTGGTSYQDAEYAAERMPNYPPLAAAPGVLESAAGAAGVPAEQLRGRISAANPDGTSQLQVTAAASEPQTAAKAADGAAEALAEHIADQDPGPVRVRAELVVPAAVPGRPISPNLSLNLAGGALGGLALGLLLALVLPGGPKVVRTAADVRRVTGLELLSQVPPPGGRHRGGPGGEPAFRELTAVLAQVNGGRLPRVVLLSSAGSATVGAKEHFMEGWARHLADGGRRVAVFEAQAGTHAPSAAVNQQGWTDLLSGGVSLAQILVPAPGDATRVPVGLAGNLLQPTDLSARAGQLLNTVAARFDLVLVPTEPVGRPLNNTLLASAVTSAVILAGYGETTEEQMDLAVLELHTLGVPVAGAVLLDVPGVRRSPVLHLSAGAAVGRLGGSATAGRPLTGPATPVPRPSQSPTALSSPCRHTVPASAGDTAAGAVPSAREA